MAFNGLTWRRSRYWRQASSSSFGIGGVLTALLSDWNPKSAEAVALLLHLIGVAWDWFGVENVSPDESADSRDPTTRLHGRCTRA